MSRIQKTTTFSSINPVFALFCRLFSYFGRFLARSCWVVLAIITIINIASTVKYHSLYYTGFPYIEVVQSLIASALAFQVLYFMHQKTKLSGSGYLDDTDANTVVSSNSDAAYIVHGYDLAKSCHSADSFDNSTLESGKRRFLGIPPFKEWNLTIVTTVVVLIVATVSATYITMCQFYDLSDIKAIIKLASHYQTWFTSSNPNSVAHISHIEHDYIQKYPYQSGMVWFVWLMTMVIPGLEASSLLHIMTTLQYVMIPFICASIILIVRLAYRFSDDNSYVAKIAAMLCLFFPVLPVVSQEVYGYNISMPFILGAFLLAYKCYDALKGSDEPDFERFWCCFAGFVVLAIILGFVKPNNIIVGIALAMGLILAAVFSSKLFNKTVSARNSSSIENEVSLADFTDSNNSTSSTGSNDSTNSTEDSANSNNSSAVSTPSRRRKKSFFSRLFNSILFAIANISSRWFNSSARKNHETWGNINAVNRITVYFKPIFKRLKPNELTVSLGNGVIDRCNVSGNGFNSDFVRTNRGVRVFRKPVLTVAENGLNVSAYEAYKKPIASIVNNTTNNNSNNSGNDSNGGKNSVGGDSCSHKRLSARFSRSNIKSFIKTQIVKPTVLLILTAIIVLPSMSLGSNIAQIGFTQVTGIDFPTNRRQKIAPFLAIGLGNKADGRMGYYNAQVSEFSIPVETINARGEKILKTRLSDFANNPSEAIRFFVLKTVQTWGDPTFLFFENPPRLTFIHFQELKEKAEKREKEKESKKIKSKEPKNRVKNKPISMFENMPNLEFSAKNATNSMFDTMKYGVKFANYKAVNGSKSGGNAHIVKPVGMGLNYSSNYTTNLLNPLNPISPLYVGNNHYRDYDNYNTVDDYCDYHDCRPHIDDDNKNPVLSNNLKTFTISNTRKLVWNDFSAFIYTFWCDIMASLIMIGTMIGFGVIMAKNKGNSYLNGKKWIILTPIIALFGGFLFHTVWEAKPPYAFYYFIYLIPFAAIGLYYSKNASIGQILNWVLYKKDKKAEKEAKKRNRM